MIAIAVNCFERDARVEGSLRRDACARGEIGASVPRQVRDASVVHNEDRHAWSGVCRG
jgi:hypothetical protein